MSHPVYLDHNATTPIAPEVAAALRPFLEGGAGFGNPSSGHAWGRAAREAVDRAREQVSTLLGCDADEVVFTACGSESDNLAIKGVAWSAGRGHLVTSAIEHPAVLEPCRWLEGQGFGLTVVPVDGVGRVDPDVVEAAIRPDTVLCSVMHANNEVGTIQPVGEIARRCRDRGVRIHVDGAQAVGKIPVDVRALGVDLYTVAGHKLGAPKGVGALYVRRGVALERLIHGAGHEGVRRAGTENVLGIVGLGAACALARQELPGRSETLGRLRDRLHDGLCARLVGVQLNGHPSERLPNTLSVAFPGVRAQALLAALSDEVAASAGAACHDTGPATVSPVLAAMGVSAERALGTVRLSVGRETTEADVDQAVARIAEVLG